MQLEPQRILIYTHSFFPSIGGVETYVQLLAEGISKHPNRAIVRIATQSPNSGASQEHFPFSVVRRPSVRRLWSEIHDADVVHVAGPALVPLLFSIAQRRPVLVEHHGYQAVCPNGLLLEKPTLTQCSGHFVRGELRSCINCLSPDVGISASLWHLVLTGVRRTLCRLATNVTVSQHVKNRLGLPVQQVIYHGIRNALPQRTCPTNPRNIRFGYLGRLVVEKGVADLVDAFEIVRKTDPTSQLVIVGDGPERPSLQERISALDLNRNVTFRGFLFGEELKKAIAEIDVLIMPSVCEETAGLSAMEHMMRGGCVLVADIGGLSEVVGEAGLKFVPGNPESLASRMVVLLNQPHLVSTFGEAARQRAEGLFAQDRMVQEHLDVYSVLGSGRNRCAKVA